MGLEEVFIHCKTFTEIETILNKLKVKSYRDNINRTIILDFTESSIFEFEYYLIRPLIKKAFLEYYTLSYSTLEFRYFDTKYRFKNN